MQHFTSLPILQVLKTINGLCKVLLQRLNKDEAEKGFVFILDTLKKVTPGETKDFLSVVKILQELSNLYLIEMK